MSEKKNLHSQNKSLLQRFICTHLMVRSGHKNIVPSQALHTHEQHFTRYKSFVTEQKKECDTQEAEEL